MTTEYLLISMVVILMPGTGVLYTLAVALGRGFSASVWAALGCTLGIVPAATASILGLAAVLHVSENLLPAVKVLGVIYLFYMAWNMLRAGGTMDLNVEHSASTSFAVAMNGTLLNVLNPKLALFFFAFLPQFVPVDRVGEASTLLMLAAVFMLLTFIVFVGYGACAALARDYVISRPVVLRWCARVFAASFGFLAIKLALS